MAWHRFLPWNPVALNLGNQMDPERFLGFMGTLVGTIASMGFMIPKFRVHLVLKE